MKYALLVTGGAGFVGSNVALFLKERHPDWDVITLDNLSRKGSELNQPRLRKAGIRFVRGDVRSPKDFEKVGPVQGIVECSAEPSVLSGISSQSVNFVVDNNLIGTVHCLNYAAKHKSDFIFLSTSRIYPIKALESLRFRETKTRFEWYNKQRVSGASSRGISEDFPLDGYRSFYGMTKLSSEFLIAEYVKFFGVRAVIDRCGVIAGPWQMGRVDQGVAALWMARHFWKKKLTYIGYGGKGKQVRDMLHILDLCELIDLQLKQIKRLNGQTFNVGGGRGVSTSLCELTEICRKLTEHRIKIKSVPGIRPADVRIYVSDYSKLKRVTGWTPRRNVSMIMSDIYHWIKENHRALESILK